MGRTWQGIDLDEWSDRIDADPDHDPTEIPGGMYGHDAEDASRALLGRVGHPTLGQGHAAGQGRSPRRQVRLTPATDAALDAYAAEHGMSVSEVIRAAIDKLLSEPAR